MLVGLVLAVFVLVNYVLPGIEGFANPNTKVNPTCPKGYKQCPSGDCIDESDIHQQCP